MQSGGWSKDTGRLPVYCVRWTGEGGRRGEVVVDVKATLIMKED